MLGRVRHTLCSIWERTDAGSRHLDVVNLAAGSSVLLAQLDKIGRQRAGSDRVQQEG
jgi:hypothetical protein